MNVCNKDKPECLLLNVFNKGIPCFCLFCKDCLVTGYAFLFLSFFISSTELQTTWQRRARSTRQQVAAGATAAPGELDRGWGYLKACPSLPLPPTFALKLSTCVGEYVRQLAIRSCTLSERVRDIIEFRNAAPTRNRTSHSRFMRFVVFLYCKFCLCCAFVGAALLWVPHFCGCCACLCCPFVGAALLRRSWQARERAQKILEEHA